MLTMGFKATRTGYLRITRHSLRPLARGGDHVGLAKLVQQVGAHDAE